MDMIAPRAFTALPGGTIHFQEDLLLGEPAVDPADPRTVVYRIRPQARWAGGAPVSAADFRYNWLLRTQDPKCGTADERQLYSQVKRVTAADNGKTVRVTFDQLDPRWRTLFSPLLPSPPGQEASAGQEPSTDQACAASVNPMGWSAGPYQVVRFETGSQAELIPNPQWYGTSPATLEKIVVRGFADQSSLLEALRTGEISVADVSGHLHRCR
jgi:peptide/nickel transport system substrate-binding protein